MKVTRLRRQPVRELLVEFIAYTAASAIALAVDVGTLVLFVEHGVHYLLAGAVAFLLGLLVVYLASIWWIFSWRTYRQDQRLEAGVFLFTAAVGLVLNLGIMWIGTDILDLYYLVPKAVSVAFVFSWNFLSRKLMLFTPHD